ncbi:MAG TPA: BadF/BadG/BcrA/BcrD ATPase family protein [Solirubrobacteraceae bacterium]|nr:BadF/BadG/BcrA/BcrD ATPase family protein [Solirubrobacteraceae bacterium]
MSRGDRVWRGRALGVDLGGSSTRAHLLDPVAAPRDLRLRGGNVALDREGVHAVLRPLLLDLRPRAACLGLAGARTAPAAAEWLRAGLSGSGCAVTVMTDAELAIRTAFGEEGDGILICAGTGTVAVARVDGVIDMVGGTGYLLGDAGGAYDLGRRIVAAALRERDLGAHDLASRLERLLGERLDDAVADIYRTPGDRSRLAGLAEHIDGLPHPAADHVLDAAAQALVDLADLARQRFGPLPIRLTGGVFRSPHIAGIVEAALDATVSSARPEVVAAELAAESIP